MLADVLKQEGITAQVMGSFLPGAMGELPAAGLVRLMVDDEDFDRARAVIGRWESTQVDLSRRPAAAAAPRASWLWGLGGLLLGAGLCWAWVRIPVYQHGFDRNRDGRTARIDFYRLGGQLEHSDRDADLDGVIDTPEHYNALGQITRTERLPPPTGS